MAIVQIQFRRDTTNNWTNVNPVLAAGEPSFNTDTSEIRVGDGVNAYNSLTSSHYVNSVQFDLTGSGVPVEGKVEWDNVNKTMVMYTDIPDVAQQMGQEMWMRVYNNTTSSIDNGKVATVIGVTTEGVPEIGLAIASEEISSKNIVGITTHIIEPQTYGRVTTLGFVNDCDTSHIPDGAAIYLSATEAGEVTHIRPFSPNYEVRMGGNARTGLTNGILYSEPMLIGNLHGITNFYNGSILESTTVVVDSDGTDVTLTLDNYNMGENLSLIFDAEFHVMTAPKTITLLSGSDTVPQPNYVYIPSSSKALEVSPTGYPQSSQFIPVATVMVQSPSSVQTNGVYKLHKWADDLLDPSGMGHLAFITSFIRQEHPKYKSGNTLTTIPASENTTTDRIDLQYSNGVISQIHFQLTPGYDTSVGTDDPIWIVNDPTTPYKLINGLTSQNITQDSTGTLIGNNQFYNVVIWGSTSRNLSDCKLFMNLPNGTYTKIEDAIIDTDRTANYSFPRDFNGSAYLMTKLTLQKVGTDIKIVTGGRENLLGLFPSTGAGGGTIGGQGTIAGTINTNQVAFGDSLNSISGSSNFTYDGTNLAVGGLIIDNQVPTSSSGSGKTGEIRTDENFIYVCTTTDTWKRSPLSTW